MESLDKLVLAAKDQILVALDSKGMNGKNLQANVLSQINWHETREGEIVHETKTIHVAAYIIAYKQLEEEGKIEIMRPKDVPFPMTDDKTAFMLR